MGKQLNDEQAETQRIQDDGDLRKYRIELPNLYDDADLDPYEFRLLAHYKRVGACYESTRTTAARCKMSMGKVSAARDSLHEKGFIVIDEYLSEHDTIQIKVVDRWAENFAKYSAMKAQKQARSENEQGVHVVNSECSQSETKKEPIEEKNIYKTVSNPELARCWKDLSEMLGSQSASLQAKFLETWDEHPDPRRADFALEQTKKYCNPVSWKYYEACFVRYDPDKKPPAPKPTYARAPARPAANVRDKPITDADRAAMVEQWKRDRAASLAAVRGARSP